MALLGGKPILDTWKVLSRAKQRKGAAMSPLAAYLLGKAIEVAFEAVPQAVTQCVAFLGAGAGAATAIQNAQRSRVARKRVASKRYDKMVRDEDAAARFRRREKAAKLLQRAGRGFVGRRRFGKRKKARDAEEARRHEAATTIQGLGRARSGRLCRCW